MLTQLWTVEIQNQVASSLLCVKSLSLQTDFLLHSSMVYFLCLITTQMPFSSEKDTNPVELDLHL
jgi:hypothetical protein